MGITYKHELITPNRARQLLGDNAENNRLPKKSKIPAYARDMLTGHWHAHTGETIKIDTEGKLIDGQNRMHAVILAGVPIYFDVAYDVPTLAMQVLDTGTPRGAADVLKIAGAQDRMRSGAIVRWAIMWDAKLFTGMGSTLKPTTTEIILRYTSEPGVFSAAASRATDCQHRGLGTGAPAGVAYYLFSKIDQEETHAFFDQYVSGANLPDASPILTLRNKMTRLCSDRLTRPEQLALFVRAWNAYREGRTLSQIVIISGGKLGNDNFPQPR